MIDVVRDESYESLISQLESESKNGNVKSIETLIQIYQNGIGGQPKDFERAQFWREELQKITYRNERIPQTIGSKFSDDKEEKSSALPFAIPFAAPLAEYFQELFTSDDEDSEDEDEDEDEDDDDYET